MNNPKVKILVTGGTIDGIDYESEKDIPINPQSYIQKMFELSRIPINYEIKVLMLKDSRAITDADRELILEECKNSIENNILITHGTITMPQTAKFLGQANLGKTIVLVGSIIPSQEENSDAMFNLGAGYLASKILPHGVSIVMNGRVFNWDNVHKVSDKYFEEER